MAGRGARGGWTAQPCGGSRCLHHRSQHFASGAAASCFLGLPSTCCGLPAPGGSWTFRGETGGLLEPDLLTLWSGPPHSPIGSRVPGTPSRLLVGPRQCVAWGSAFRQPPELSGEPRATTTTWARGLGLSSARSGPPPAPARQHEAGEILRKASQAPWRGRCLGSWRSQITVEAGGPPPQAPGSSALGGRLSPGGAAWTSSSEAGTSRSCQGS